jgi:glutamine amidotransferase
MGNLGSISNMFKKIGVSSTVSSDPRLIITAEKLILPGVGAFDNGMKNLEERGLVPFLNEAVLVKKRPILGLCLGMQLFTKQSEEGQLPGLGWLNAETVRFDFDTGQSNLKIPHMGWNTVQICQRSPLLENIAEEPRFYFLHSYHVVCYEPPLILGETHYGHNFSSIIGRGNILGVQFHPEKSHKFGMSLLKNFAALN